MKAVCIPQLASRDFEKMRSCAARQGIPVTSLKEAELPVSLKHGLWPKTHIQYSSLCLLATQQRELEGS